VQYLQGSNAVSDLSDNAAPAKPEKTTPRWRRWAGEALLFIVIVAGVQFWQARDAPRGPAPEFAGHLVDGQPFDLAAWRAAHAGRPVLLYFWAEWCPICKTTAGNVTNISADWPVTSIAIQSGTAEQVARVMAEKGYRWPTLADPAGEVLRQYGLAGTPAFVVINPAGDVRFVSLGYTSELGLRLRLWWAGREAS
jgi:thiol-disulfide isomerase/thioredoxin